MGNRPQGHGNCPHWSLCLCTSSSLELSPFQGLATEFTVPAFSGLLKVWGIHCNAQPHDLPLRRDGHRNSVHEEGVRGWTEAVGHTHFTPCGPISSLFWRGRRKGAGGGETQMCYIVDGTQSCRPELRGALIQTWGASPYGTGPFFSPGGERAPVRRTAERGQVPAGPGRSRCHSLHAPSTSSTMRLPRGSVVTACLWGQSQLT